MRSANKMKKIVPQAARIPASQRYRARAEECRVNARSFRDESARTQMLHLADDYERKAVQAEVFERLEPKDSDDLQHPSLGHMHNTTKRVVK